MKKLALLSLSALALFANPPKERIGLQGSLEIAFGAMSKKSNSINAIPFGSPDNKKLNSINSDGESFSSLMVLPRVNVAYVYEDKSSISFGNASGHEFQLAYAKPMEFGKLEVGYVPGFSDEWKNPYETTMDREESTYENHKFFVKAENEDFEVEAFYRNATQHDDKTLGFTDLGRTGHENGFAISKKSGLNSYKIGYSKFSSLGRADSYSDTNLGYKVFIPFIKNKKIISNIAYSKKDFEEVHPLYNKEREDDSLLLTSIVIFEDFFQDKRKYLSSGLILGKTDSNINFFDDSLTMVFVGIGQRF